MKLKELLIEKYDKKHKCLTPGTIYKTKIHSDHISIRLNLPEKVKEISKEDSEDLEADIHYALEKVLAKYYF
jgi:hypothetical protein